MIKIKFYEDSNLVDVSLATEEYQKIWDEEGVKIVSAWEKITGLTFRETFINGVILEGRGQSHPLSLRASLSPEMKKATLVHEMGHRILFKKMKLTVFNKVEVHKRLNLCLYDVLVDLYGKEFSDFVVQNESKVNEYKEAWDWALSFTKEERHERFNELLM